MTIDRLPFERRPRNSIANNLDKINELVDWANLGTHLYASATGESVTMDDASSVKGLTVDGRSVQNGTPTPGSPVPVQVVEGRNLLDVDSPAVLNGKFIMSDGSLTNSASWNVSEYIPVSDSDYVLHGMGTGSAVCYALYNGSYGLLSAVPYSNRTTIKISATGASYLRVCFNTENKETAQLEKGSTATPYTPYGYISILIGDTLTPINLQGNKLASLPDGTRDELHVDSAGHVTIDSDVDKIIFDGTENWTAHSSASNVYYIDQPQFIGAASLSQTGYALSNRYSLIQASSAANMQNNTFFINASSRLFVRNDALTTLENFKADLASNGMIVFGKLATPQTIDLGYITPPAIPSGSVVTISASLTPTFHLEWWVDDGITALVNDLIAYIDYKTKG